MVDRQGGRSDQSSNGETPDITTIKSRGEKILSERVEAPPLDKKFLDAATDAARNAAEAARAAMAAEADRDSIRNFIGKLIMLAFLPCFS